MKPIHLLGFFCVALVLLLLQSMPLHAQVYTYKLGSSPDSAEVIMNGKSIGKTPLEAKVDWSQAQGDGFVFLFQKEGYQTDTFKVAEKPKYKENYKDMVLEKIRPHFELEPNCVLVNFEKIMTEFPLGQVIGHNKTFYGGDITWLGYSRVGVEQFALRADDVLGSAGFRTPAIKKNELFSGQTGMKSEPRFLLGAKLTDIWVGLGPSTLIGIMAKNRCTIEWMVFDQKLKQVVLTVTSEGVFEGKYQKVTELNVMMDLFQDAMENFLMGGELAELVKSAGPDIPVPVEDPNKKPGTH